MLIMVKEDELFGGRGTIHEGFVSLRRIDDHKLIVVKRWGKRKSMEFVGTTRTMRDMNFVMEFARFDELNVAIAVSDRIPSCFGVLIIIFVDESFGDHNSASTTYLIVVLDGNDASFKESEATRRAIPRF